MAISNRYATDDKGDTWDQNEGVCLGWVAEGVVEILNDQDDQISDLVRMVDKRRHAEAGKHRLLKACEMFVDAFVDYHGHHSPENCPAGNPKHCEYCTGRAAIAKAKGKNGEWTLREQHMTHNSNNQIISADVVLALMLRTRMATDIAELVGLRKRVFHATERQILLDVSHDELAETVALHPELMQWGEGNQIVRSAEAADLLDQGDYVDRCYAYQIPEAFRETVVKILGEASSQSTQTREIT